MIKNLCRTRVLAWSLALLVGVSCAPVNAKTAKSLDIVDTVSTNVILTSFAKMIQASDLATFLSSRGPFTLFVPTDSAFSKLPPGTLDVLLQPQNKERLQHIVLFHLVNGKRLSAKDLLTVTNLLSCEGTPLPVKKNRLGVQVVAKAKIVHADIKCLNGMIHEVDTLLMPPEASLPPLVATPPPAATNAAPTNATPLDPPDTNAISDPAAVTPPTPTPAPQISAPSP